MCPTKTSISPQIKASLIWSIALREPRSRYVRFHIWTAMPSLSAPAARGWRWLALNLKLPRQSFVPARLQEQEGPTFLRYGLRSTFAKGCCGHPEEKAALGAVFSLFSEATSILGGGCGMCSASLAAPTAPRPAAPSIARISRRWQTRCSRVADEAAAELGLSLCKRGGEVIGKRSGRTQNLG